MYLSSSGLVYLSLDFPEFSVITLRLEYFPERGFQFFNISKLGINALKPQKLCLVIGLWIKIPDLFMQLRSVCIIVLDRHFGCLMEIGGHVSTFRIFKKNPLIPFCSAFPSSYVSHSFKTLTMNYGGSHLLLNSQGSDQSRPCQTIPNIDVAPPMPSSTSFV